MKTKPRINTEWHKKHPLPKNTTTDQHIQWHLQHAKHFQCRIEFPEKIKEEMKSRNIAVPLGFDL